MSVTDVGNFSIGVHNIKSWQNTGTLMRSAFQLGADSVFTIGRRYKRQRSDVFNLSKHLEVSHHKDFESFLAAVPTGVKLVAIERGGKPLKDFVHPERAIYLLGAEDHGLSMAELSACDEHVTIEAVRQPMFNVSVAGSIVMYHRLHQKRDQQNEIPSGEKRQWSWSNLMPVFAAALGGALVGAVVFSRIATPPASPP